MKYRLKYVKEDNLVFISHLDILKVLQRSFRRADIHLMHSQGFNPHPKVHFAPPLPLFTSSKGEYVDVETKEDISPSVLLDKLNKALPTHLQLVEAFKLDEDAISLGKSLDNAIYKITFTLEGTSDKLVEGVNNFINSSEELLITKKNKKGRIKTRDIKPNILSFKALKEDNNIIIDTSLSLRTDRVLSPTNVINILKDNFDEIRVSSKIKIEKKDTILFSN